MGGEGDLEPLPAKAVGLAVKGDVVAALRQELLGYGKPDPDYSEDEGLTLADIREIVMSDCSDGNFVGCDLFKEIAQHVEPDTHFFVNCSCWGTGDYFWLLYYDSYGNSDEDSGAQGPGDTGNWYRARQVIAERQKIVPAWTHHPRESTSSLPSTLRLTPARIVANPHAAPSASTRIQPRPPRPAPGTAVARRARLHGTTTPAAAIPPRGNPSGA